MSKQDIINYVLKTPSNTNPAVLDTMLNELSGGGGGGGGVNLHTATLTIVGGSDTTVISLLPYLDESTGYLDNKDAPLTGSYTIPLFNAEGGGGIYNAAIWEGASKEQISMSTSGDITIEEDYNPESGEYIYFATITGDCTITIS